MKIFQQPAEAAVRALLTQCALPTSDLEPRHFEHFFATGSISDPAAIVGVEIEGLYALLRSLAVSPAARGKGYGRALVRHAESYAHGRGVHDMYLLTNTAEMFFAGLGYQRITRESAPKSIRRSEEFARLCPARAACMTKALGETAP